MTQRINIQELKESEYTQADLMHLCLVFLSEDFSDLGQSGDALIRYLQSVFTKKAGDPDYNPYALYSKSIVKEADEIMTIVGMFEKRGEARGCLLYTSPSPRDA